PWASPTPRCPTGTGVTATSRVRRLAMPLHLTPSETAAQVVVHHAGGLHESVADRRAHESEASPEQIPAHRPRRVGLGRAVAMSAPRVLRRVAADELPDVGIEASVLALHRQERPRIGDRGVDLRPVADDALVVHEPAYPRRGVARDLLRVESVERLPVRLALSQDGGPAEPGLGALEDQKLEQKPVPMDRHAPLSVVILSLELASGPRAAWLVHRSLRASMVLPDRD